MIGHRLHYIFRSGDRAEGLVILQTPAQRPLWILSTAPSSCLFGNMFGFERLLEDAVITEDSENRTQSLAKHFQILTK